MAKETKIQWTGSTVNPVMGCLGCELFLAVGLILALLDQRLSRFGIVAGYAKHLLEELIAESWQNLPEDVDRAKFSPGLTTTNAWHHRHLLGERVAAIYGAAAGEEAVRVIEEGVICYTAREHLKKGFSLNTVHLEDFL